MTDDHQKLIECGHAEWLEFLQKNYDVTAPWLRVAASNMQDIEAIKRVSQDPDMLSAASEIDMSRFGIDIIKEVVTKGGALPTQKDRDVLANRIKITGLLEKLTPLLAGDEDLKRLTAVELHALALDPLQYHLHWQHGKNFPDIGNSFMAARFHDMIDGMAKRLHAEKAFGLRVQEKYYAHPKIIRTEPHKVLENQRAMLETKLEDYFRLHFQQPKFRVIALLVAAAFDKRADVDRLIDRAKHRTLKTRKAPKTPKG